MSSPLESLPAELFIQVCSNLAYRRSDLASLAAASRQCQTHVEPITFKSLLVKPSGLPEFQRIVGRHRFRVLRHLLYDASSVCQEELSALTPSTRIEASVLTACSEIFTAAIRDLLTALDQKAREDSEHRHTGISLSFATPSMPDSGSVETREIFAAQRSPSDDEQVKFEVAWLRILSGMFPTDLAVSVVTRLHYSGVHGSTYGCWDIWPASWIAYAAQLPSLAELDLILLDGSSKCQTSRRRARDALGTSLVHLPAALRKLNLAYTSSMPENQFFAPQDLRDPELGYDIFSHELALLSRRLVRLEIARATMDLVAFFHMMAQNQCSCLEEVSFEQLQLASADGAWYFGLQPGAEQEGVDEDAPTLDEMREYLEEDELPALEDHPMTIFRTVMDDAKFMEIYTAAAAAAKARPNLRELFINFEDIYGGEHNFVYARGPSKKFFWASTAEIKVAWDLRPVTDVHEEVRKAWENVGKAYKASTQILRGNCNGYTWFGDIDYYQTIN